MPSPPDRQCYKELDMIIFLLPCHQWVTNARITKRKNEATNVTITMMLLRGLKCAVGIVGPEIKREFW
jgi:hypothetical protein